MIPMLQSAVLRNYEPYYLSLQPYNYKVHHLDVVTAFLNPSIDQDNLYMTMPSGIEKISPKWKKTSTVCLHKALYGLKQALHLWYQDINDFLLLSGFEKSKAEPNLYLQDLLLLLLYVDDM